MTALENDSLRSALASTPRPPRASAAVASATQPASARIMAAVLLFLDIVALLALRPCDEHVRRSPG